MAERTRDGVLLAGRLLLAGCLAPSAIARALNPSGFAVTLASEGLPFATEAAAVLVVVGVLAPLALAAGVLPRITAALAIAHAAFLTLLLHRFWEFGGVFRQAEQATFVAALATIAALLLYAQAGPGGWSWAALRGRLLAPATPDRKRPAPRNGRNLKAA